MSKNKNVNEREKRLIRLRHLLFAKSLDPVDPCGYYWIHFYVSIYKGKIKEFQYYDDFQEALGFHYSRKLERDLEEILRRGWI